MERDILKAHQARLAERGWYQGELDGLPGALTDAAFSRFKGACGFRARPLPISELTLLRLWADDAPRAPMLETANANKSLLDVAMQYDGLREIAGKRHNQTILGWLKVLRLGWANDEVPWCGVFVGGVVREWNANEPLPNNPAGARNWLNFGRDVDDDPRPGDVVVFWRGSRSGWKGHVGFVARVHSNGDVDCLGGNQSNAVNIRRFPKARVLGYRRPIRSDGGPSAAEIVTSVQMTDGNEA